MCFLRPKNIMVKETIKIPILIYLMLYTGKANKKYNKVYAIYQVVMIAKDEVK